MGECWWGSYAGFYGDYVFNRNMECERSAKDNPNIDDFELTTNAGYIALTLWDRIEAFATLGASSLNLECNRDVFADFGNANGRFFIYSSTDFSWSIGGRCTALTICDFSLGFEGQYFRTNPSVLRLTSEGNNSTYPSGYNILYTEWQVGFGASYCVGPMVRPYMGVMYARAHTDSNDRTITVGGGAFTINDMKNTKPWEYAVGISFPFCDEVAFTVEGRFAGEKALYVNGTIRF